MPFSALGLSPALHTAAARATGLHTASAIQQRAIPPLLTGSDAMLCAPTGSGKTLAYALPLLQHLLNVPPPAQRQVRALLLLPTRELVLQVAQVVRSVTQQLPQALTVHSVYGGVSINPQMRALRGGTEVLVATPGRLLDLVAQHAVQLSQVEYLVLDEADRMLDLGFAHELEQVLQCLPTRRTTVLVSATMTPAARHLASTLLQQPVLIEAPADETRAPEIVQRAIQVDTPRRTQLLRHLITTEPWSRVLVFVATKLASEIVADKLRRAGLLAEPFHGELSQGKRNQVLTDFKAERIGVVVATDVAARGLDIAQLPVVVNYDLPRSTADYTHRIGRTGRAGAAGLAVSFVTADNVGHFRLIQKRHQLTMELEVVDGFAPEPAGHNTMAATTTAPTGGIKGARPSKKDKLRAAAAAAGATANASPGVNTDT